MYLITFFNHVLAEHNQHLLDHIGIDWFHIALMLMMLYYKFWDAANRSEAISRDAHTNDVSYDVSSTLIESYSTITTTSNHHSILPASPTKSFLHNPLFKGMNTDIEPLPGTSMDDTLAVSHHTSPLYQPYIPTKESLMNNDDVEDRMLDALLSDDDDDDDDDDRDLPFVPNPSSGVCLVDAIRIRVKDAKKCLGQIEENKTFLMGIHHMSLDEVRTKRASQYKSIVGPWIFEMKKVLSDLEMLGGENALDWIESIVT